MTHTANDNDGSGADGEANDAHNDGNNDGDAECTGTYNSNSDADNWNSAERTLKGKQSMHIHNYLVVHGARVPENSDDLARVDAYPGYMTTTRATTAMVANATAIINVRRGIRWLECPSLQVPFAVTWLTVGRA